MSKRWMLAVLAAATALSSCAYDTLDDEYVRGDGPDPPTFTSTAAPAPADEAVLGVAPSTLGEIVVDADGMTVYVYGNDEVGSETSACTGSCLDAWKPVTTVTETPQVEGIDAAIGTIPAKDDTFQVTVNGRPVYGYVQDEVPGDVLGQDVGQQWWVLDPSGNPIRESPG